jgi:hypothetical protein
MASKSTDETRGRGLRKGRYAGSGGLSLVEVVDELLDELVDGGLADADLTEVVERLIDSAEDRQEVLEVLAAESLTGEAVGSRAGRRTVRAGLACAAMADLTTDDASFQWSVTSTAVLAGLTERLEELEHDDSALALVTETSTGPRAVVRFLCGDDEIRESRLRRIVAAFEASWLLEGEGDQWPHGPNYRPSIEAMIAMTAHRWARIVEPYARGGLTIQDVVDTVRAMSSRRSEQRLLDLFLGVLGFLEEGRVLEFDDGERVEVVEAGDRVEHFHRPMVRPVSEEDDGRTFRLEPHRTVTWMSEPQG